jgi:hypothetical protein
MSHVERKGKLRNAYKILVRKPRVMRLYEISRCTGMREVNITINFRETVCQVADWIQLAKWRMTCFWEYGKEPWGSINARNFLIS